MRVTRLEPVFVDSRPDNLEPGKVYIAMPFRTSVHLCCCGCANEVWLPIRPNMWKLIYDGRDVSFAPSIGNWSFPCQTHYWIRDGRVKWAPSRKASPPADGAVPATAPRDPRTAGGSDRRRWWQRLLYRRRWKG